MSKNNNIIFRTVFAPNFPDVNFFNFFMGSNSQQKTCCKNSMFSRASDEQLMKLTSDPNGYVHKCLCTFFPIFRILRRFSHQFCTDFRICKNICKKSRFARIVVQIKQTIQIFRRNFPPNGRTNGWTDERTNFSAEIPPNFPPKC